MTARQRPPGNAKIRIYHAAERIKAELTPVQVFENYGFHPNSHGYVLCPFHGEKTPSLKLYSGEKSGWHCFGCGAGGTVIDFVMKLFGISFQQALVRLDADFNLGLTCQKPAPAACPSVLTERRRALARQEALELEIKNLSREHLRLHRNVQLYRPDKPGIESFHPLFAEAVKKLPELEYRIEEAERELRELYGARTDKRQPARVYP